MAILRRRKIISFMIFGCVLFCAAIWTSVYTADSRTIIVGDGPLIIDAKATPSSFHGDKKTGDVGDLYRSLFSGAGFTNDTGQKPEETMQARKRRLKEACALLKDAHIEPPNQAVFRNEQMRHLMINDDKQILYCYLPKVANTNFRRVFLGLQGDVPRAEVTNVSGYDVYFTHDKKFQYLSLRKPTERENMLKTYRKFIFVRDPLERLLSGYRNKFFHPNERHKAEYHGRVLEFYKKHPALRQKHNMRTDFQTKELTFKEFLIYWTDVFSVKEYLNEHFVASNQLCDPCNIHFDFIGKYESLQEDTKFIFDKLNIDIPFPGRNDNYSTAETGTLVEEYYKPIPDWLLKKTWDVLKYDYALFGYKLPDWYLDKLKETR